MRILVFGTVPYRNTFAKSLGEHLNITVFDNVEDAVNEVHILNYQDEATEDARVALEPDVTIWINMDGTSDDDPETFDVRLQEVLSAKHMAKMANGINERYINKA